MFTLLQRGSTEQLQWSSPHISITWNSPFAFHCTYKKSLTTTSQSCKCSRDCPPLWPDHLHLPWAPHTTHPPLSFCFSSMLSSLPPQGFYSCCSLWKNTLSYDFSVSSNVISSERSSLTTAEYFPFVPLNTPSTHLYSTLLPRKLTFVE